MSSLHLYWSGKYLVGKFPRVTTSCVKSIRVDNFKVHNKVSRLLLFDDNKIKMARYRRKIRYAAPGKVKYKNKYSYDGSCPGSICNRVIYR